jgi:pilus assembly protein Flp/PilA
LASKAQVLATDERMEAPMSRYIIKLQTMRSERGATAVEYGLMVALIAIVIIAAVTLLGQNISAVFDDAANTI